MSTISRGREANLNSFISAGFVSNIDELNRLPEEEYNNLSFTLKLSNIPDVIEVKATDSTDDTKIVIPELSVDQRVDKIVETSKIENGINAEELFNDGKELAKKFISYYSKEMKPTFNYSQMN